MLKDGCLHPCTERLLAHQSLPKVIFSFTRKLGMSYSQNWRAFGGRLKAHDCNPPLDEDAQGWLLAPLHRKTACTSVTPNHILIYCTLCDPLVHHPDKPTGHRSSQGGMPDRSPPVPDRSTRSPVRDGAACTRVDPACLGPSHAPMFKLTRP
jgi:hypothetical protein